VRAQSLASLLRAKSPLTCKLLDECLSREFWVLAQQSGASFGLATWILTLIAVTPGVVAAHYAAVRVC
jgi:uncharacterized membrane protein